MAVFVSDAFTDTDTTALQSHTGETGATWTEHANELGNDATIVSNQCKHIGSSGVSYYASGTASSNEYDVEATNIAATSASIGTGIYGRLLTSALTGYLAWGAGSTTLYKVTAGAFTSLGTYASAWASSDAIKLQIRSATKKIFINGTERISSANNDHTGTGNAGIRFYGAGGILDAFVATDLSGGGGGVSIPVLMKNMRGGFGNQHGGFING